MGVWEEIDHTADLALRVQGRDLADLFVTAAEGMFSLMAALEQVEPVHEVSLHLSAPDVETLLVDWLSELLYLSELRGLVFVRFELDTLSETEIAARAQGGPAGEYRAAIKAVTYHNLAVRLTSEGYETEIVFDT